MLQLGGHPEPSAVPARGLPKVPHSVSTYHKQAAGDVRQDLRQVSKQHQSKSIYFVQFWMVFMRLWFHVMHDDSTTCPIIMSEAQYEAYLRNLEQHPIRSKKVIPFNSVDGGHGSMDLSLDLKQDLEVVKAKLDSAVIDLWELKVQVQVVKKDYVIIAAVCVGVAIGCLMSKIWK